MQRTLVSREARGSKVAESFGLIELFGMSQTDARRTRRREPVSVADSLFVNERSRLLQTMQETSPDTNSQVGSIRVFVMCICVHGHVRKTSM